MLSPFAENSFPKSMELDNILAMLSAKLEKIHSLLIQDFGPNGVYIMTAFSGFLLLILIIYIKSVLDTFRIADGETQDAGLFYTTTGTTSFPISRRFIIPVATSSIVPSPPLHAIRSYLPTSYSLI